ncbi:MAG: hypothetical protein JWN23_623 [Rhodocyclales bacterium]|nr:hypothetical protein [Rhodocyclales bacterium]
MQRIQHDLLPGTESWQQFRMEHDGASEAAAMLGLSGTTTRNELLRLKHTGIAKEFCDWVQQNVLDYGHEVEAKARPIVEAMIEEDLYPVTFSYGQMSASCDGLTMNESTAFEHKQHNVELAASVRAGVLPEAHMPQCQQIMFVTGAQKVIFVCSDGTEDNFVCIDVLPDPAWFARIEAGWKQFHEDLLDYAPADIAPKAVPAPVKDLPAIVYRLNGLALQSNLPEYKAAALQLVEDSKRELVTDQDFADRDTLCKAFKLAEQSIELKKKQVLGEITDVDTFCRALDEIGALIRQARLAGEKMVEAEKTNRKTAIVAGAREKWEAHLAGLNKQLGKPYMPVISADFGLSIKGLKSLESMHNAVDTELSRAKIEANAVAQRIQLNLASLTELASDHKFLFADTAQLVLKQNDDLIALVKTRIAEHQAAEAKRLDAERQRIRAEEQAKAEKEAAAKVKAEQDVLEAKAREEERARQLATATPAQTPAAEPVTLRQVLHSALAAPVADAISPSTPPTLTLGNISKRLGFDVRADFLHSLGFEGHKDRSAILYHESDYPRICAAIIAHIQNVSSLRAAA